MVFSLLDNGRISSLFIVYPRKFILFRKNFDLLMDILKSLSCRGCSTLERSLLFWSSSFEQINMSVYVYEDAFQVHEDVIQILL